MYTAIKYIGGIYTPGEIIPENDPNLSWYVEAGAAVEQSSESKELRAEAIQRAESGELRAESRELSAESGELRAEGEVQSGKPEAAPAKKRKRKAGDEG